MAGVHGSAGSAGQVHTPIGEVVRANTARPPSIREMNEQHESRLFDPIIERLERAHDLSFSLWQSSPRRLAPTIRPYQSAERFRTHLRSTESRHSSRLLFARRRCGSQGGFT